MPCIRPSSGSHDSDGYLAAGQAANCHARFARSFRSAPLHPCRRQALPEWLRPVHSHTLRARKSSEADYQPTEAFDAVWPERDAAFRSRIAAASEWTKLELLFRTLAELKAEPLILSMPIDAYAARGVSRSTRELYYDRMRQSPSDIISR